MVGTGEVDGALKELREMLASDGYLVSWEESAPSTVAIRIEAGADACADCLVPQPVLEAILGQALAATPYSLGSVEMPAEGAAAH